MGILDDAKKLAEGAKDKATEFVSEHKDQVKGGIDKVADFAETKLGKDKAGKVDDAADKAKGFVEKLADDAQGGSDAAH